MFVLKMFSDCAMFVFLNTWRRGPPRVEEQVSAMARYSSEKIVWQIQDISFRVLYTCKRY